MLCACASGLQGWSPPDFNYPSRMARDHYSIEQQRELAAYTPVIFERCFVSMTHRCGFIPLTVIERAIADVGVATTILSTDLGQPDTPTPAEGLLLYANQLRACGFSVDDLRVMMRDDPEKLLKAADHNLINAKPAASRSQSPYLMISIVRNGVFVCCCSSQRH